MQAPGIPVSIPRAQMAAAMRTLGIDPMPVVAVSYGVEEVQITRHRLDENGKYVMDGDHLATETFTVPVI